MSAMPREAAGTLSQVVRQPIDRDVVRCGFTGRCALTPTSIRRPGTSAAELAEKARPTWDAPGLSGPAAFRSGESRTLVLSRVGNFAIDLPEASVLIQISGTMGSRQEEAQRLGRILRPKPGGASFYTIVTRHSCEEDLAMHRQLFLTEQGYRFFIEGHDALAADPHDTPIVIARSLDDVSTGNESGGLLN